MPSNQTSNYKLSQWVKSDRVLMEDFNADNAKIDAALAKKAEQSALTSLQSTVSTKADKSSLTSLEATVSKKADQTSLEALQTAVSKKAEQSALDALKQTVNSHTTELVCKGNCRVWTTTYTGTGSYGVNSPNKLTFPAKPTLVIIGERANNGTTLITFYNQPNAFAYNSTVSLNTLTWSGNTMTWYTGASVIGQLNQQGVTYDVLALISL